jgi:hypothetical protein
MISLVARHWSLVIGFVLLTAMHWARADGGAVLAQQISGPYRITLFGSPAPLRAGPADLSVLIQDVQTGEAVLNPEVGIQVQATSNDGGEAWLPPCCSMKTGVSTTVTATHEAAQNKLLYAANTVIPSSGPHKILVRLDGADALSAPVEIAPPLSPVTNYWTYLAFPPLAIVGFALNQHLRRRR